MLPGGSQGNTRSYQTDTGHGSRGDSKGQDPGGRSKSVLFKDQRDQCRWSPVVKWELVRVEKQGQGSCRAWRPLSVLHSEQGGKILEAFEQRSGNIYPTIFSCI